MQATMAMAGRTVTAAGLTPRQTYDLAGHDIGVMHAMVAAERNGSAVTGGARISLAGYQRGVTEFNAGTALYRVTW